MVGVELLEGDELADELDTDDGGEGDAEASGTGEPRLASIKNAHNRSALERVNRPQFGAPTGNRPLFFNISNCLGVDSRQAI